MLNLPAGQTYRESYELTKGKDYYIITTNQDAQFSNVFDPERIFTVQGDAHWMQCARRCHDRIYPSPLVSLFWQTGFQQRPLFIIYVMPVIGSIHFPFPCRSRCFFSIIIPLSWVDTV